MTRYIILTILIVQVAFASPNVAFASNCSRILNFSSEDAAAADWRSIIHVWFVEKILTPQDLQSILIGENPFKNRRDQDALVFKITIDQLLVEMNSSVKLKTKLAEYLKSQDLVLIDVQIQNKATEYPYRKMKFVEIIGGSINELYESVPVDKIQETIKPFEVLEYPITIHQYIEQIGKSGMPSSMLKDLLRELSEANGSVITEGEAFDGPMRFSSRVQVKELIRSLNSSDTKFSYRLLTPDELLWVVKKSNFGSEISLPYKVRRYVEGFDQEDRAIKITPNLLELVAPVASNSGYSNSHKSILVNGKIIFLPLTIRPNCVQQKSSTDDGENYITLLSVYRLMTHTELLNWLGYESNIFSYPHPQVQLVRELKLQEVAK